MIAGGIKRWMAFAAAAAYLLIPGPQDAFFSGIPIGLGPFVVFAIGIFVWVFFRSAPEPPRGWALLTAMFVALCAVKAVAAVAAPPVGWIGRYYANASFSPPYRLSTEFASLDATRIDRAIDFKDDGFPVYFLNEADFNRDIRREVTMPVSVVWDGYVQPAAVTPVRLALTVRGTATVSVDDRDVMLAASSDVPAAQSEVVTLDRGLHRIEVRYLKPAGADPLIRLQPLTESSGDAALLVTPRATEMVRRSLFSGAVLVARIADALAGLAFIAVIWSLAGMRRDAPEVRRWWRADPVRVLGAAMFGLLLIQGTIAAAPYVHHAVSLSGGDDWLAFEARAREVVTGGLLMRFGRPLGAGEVFYYYPGYSYFLAAVHRVAGEDLSGPILANFLLLFLANIVCVRLASALFGRAVALGATAALVLIEELAFIRHYTPVLLSENLYIFTVPLAIFGLVRFLQDDRPAPLLWAGLAAGVSAVTRPVMMLYLAPAATIVAIGAWRQRHDVAWVFRSVTLLIGSWMAVVSLITFRNYLVAGSAVLICETPAHMFVQYNIPPTVAAHPYLLAYTGGLGSATRVLGHIIVDHPFRWAGVALTKIGFSFGVLSLLGGRIHPELILASCGYFAALVGCQRARAIDTWPIHGFVLAHLAGMVLSMPTIYGYRLILPMYPLLPMFGALFVAAVITNPQRLPAGDRPNVAPAIRHV